jgi:CheY-like chemotaxis protein
MKNLFRFLINQKHTLGLSFVYDRNASPSLDSYFDLPLYDIIAILIFSPYQPFDIVILDYKMPQINGLDVAKEIFSVYRRQRILLENQCPLKLRLIRLV